MTTLGQQRLAFHREKARDTAEYFRAKNAKEMADWRESQGSIDRNDPDALEASARAKGERGMALVTAATVLEGERREGALKRAGRLLREEKALLQRATRLRAGEKPLDEWAVCRCGGAFQPGDRGYTQCWPCSSKDYFASSYACIFCDRRHSMSYAACFVCKADGREDDARHLRLVTYTRDSWTCQLCGSDGTMETFDDVGVMETSVDIEEVPIVGGGIALQVDRINPEGGNWPWNLQTVCGDCSRVKGRKSYGKLDERAFWLQVAEYAGPLFDYLAHDERAVLLSLLPDSDGGERVERCKGQPWLDVFSPEHCHPDVAEDDGILNVMTLLDARPVSVEKFGITPQTGPDACKGDIWLSTGKRPCRNTTDHRDGTLCSGPCR